MINRSFYQQYLFAHACSHGEVSLSFTTGMDFSNCMELSSFSGKVVSVYIYMLTDRNYVSKSTVVSDFLYLFLTARMEFSS